MMVSLLNLERMGPISVAWFRFMGLLVLVPILLSLMYMSLRRIGPCLGRRRSSKPSICRSSSRRSEPTTVYIVRHGGNPFVDGYWFLSGSVWDPNGRTAFPGLIEVIRLGGCAVVPLYPLGFADPSLTLSLSLSIEVVVSSELSFFLLPGLIYPARSSWS